jgi:hypothetical protein
MKDNIRSLKLSPDVGQLIKRIGIIGIASIKSDLLSHLAEYIRTRVSHWWAVANNYEHSVRAPGKQTLTDDQLKAVLSFGARGKRGLDGVGIAQYDIRAGDLRPVEFHSPAGLVRIAGAAIEGHQLNLLQILVGSGVGNRHELIGILICTHVQPPRTNSGVAVNICLVWLGRKVWISGVDARRTNLQVIITGTRSDKQWVVGYVADARCARVHATVAGSRTIVHLGNLVAPDYAVADRTVALVEPAAPVGSIACYSAANNQTAAVRQARPFVGSAIVGDQAIANRAVAPTKPGGPRRRIAGYSAVADRPAAP